MEETLKDEWIDLPRQTTPTARPRGSRRRAALPLLPLSPEFVAPRSLTALSLLQPHTVGVSSVSLLEHRIATSAASPASASLLANNTRSSSPSGRGASSGVEDGLGMVPPSSPTLSEIASALRITGSNASYTASPATQCIIRPPVSPIVSPLSPPRQPLRAPLVAGGGDSVPRSALPRLDSEEAPVDGLQPLLQLASRSLFSASAMVPAVPADAAAGRRENGRSSNGRRGSSGAAKHQAQISSHSRSRKPRNSAPSDLAMASRPPWQTVDITTPATAADATADSEWAKGLETLPSAPLEAAASARARAPERGVASSSATASRGAADKALERNATGWPPPATGSPATLSQQPAPFSLALQRPSTTGSHCGPSTAISNAHVAATDNHATAGSSPAAVLHGHRRHGAPTSDSNAIDHTSADHTQNPARMVGATATKAGASAVELATDGSITGGHAAFRAISAAVLPAPPAAPPSPEAAVAAVNCASAALPLAPAAGPAVTSPVLELRGGHAEMQALLSRRLLAVTSAAEAFRAGGFGAAVHVVTRFAGLKEGEEEEERDHVSLLVGAGRASAPRGFDAPAARGRRRVAAGSDTDADPFAVDAVLLVDLCRRVNLAVWTTDDLRMHGLLSYAAEWGAQQAVQQPDCLGLLRALTRCVLARDQLMEREDLALAALNAVTAIFGSSCAAVYDVLSALAGPANISRSESALGSRGPAAHSGPSSGAGGAGGSDGLLAAEGSVGILGAAHSRRHREFGERMLAAFDEVAECLGLVVIAGMRATAALPLVSGAAVEQPLLRKTGTLLLATRVTNAAATWVHAYESWRAKVHRALAARVGAA